MNIATIKTDRGVMIAATIPSVMLISKPSTELVVVVQMISVNSIPIYVNIYT